MPVFALYDFNDFGSVTNDQSLMNGAQNGAYFNGATPSAAGAVLDGVDDIVKLDPSNAFQMDHGTLALDFTLASAPLFGTQTVLSRDSVGSTAGGYHIDILANGSVVVTHETAAGPVSFSTLAGFANPGDSVSLTYSWDQTGAGGALSISNTTTDAQFVAEVPAMLTMDMGTISQPWVIGAGQSMSDPDMRNNINQFFNGSVQQLSFSDSLDNLAVLDAPDANADTANTTTVTPVTVAVLANDIDPNGDALSVISAVAGHGSVVINADGTVTYTADAGFIGTDTISYTISDPTGHTDSAVVTVDVAPLSVVRDGIVSGTAGNDLIDTGFVGDPDGDRVDNLDAILPGDALQDDRIAAGAGDDTVYAGLGDDSVQGGTGDDLVYGGVGDDTLFGEAGNDELSGGLGNDSINGGIGGDTVYGGDGDDIIDTRNGAASALPDRDYPGLYPADLDPSNDLDLVFGEDGNDQITTGDDRDTVFGGTGRDLIDGGIDDDSLYGGADSDMVIGGEGSDLIDAGSGDDVVYGGLGPSFPDSLNIPDAAGDLRPDNGRDSILGGAGNDTLFGMDDDDTLSGGANNDVIDGGVDDDLIYGGTGNDILTGGQGNDTVSGDDDRDTFMVGTAGNGTGDSIDGGEGGDDFDTLNLRGTGPVRITYSATNPENGIVEFLDANRVVTGSMTFSNIENVIPCFTPGTLIATPRGEVQVQDLRVGDRVVTRDNGLQQIRWIGTKPMSWKDFAANAHLKPILVQAGSLGLGLPERDMMVSPNHRVLVANDRTQLYFDEHEVLVAAKHLVGAGGIAVVDSIGTSYVHFMCDQHEVVLSNGAWTETFQPGDMTLKGMGNAQRAEIFEIFPELKTVSGIENYVSARRTLKRHEASILMK
ncbi:MAG: Hint domain-containing protein [Microgenomates group bacterium]